jgi:uncharacterized repeat protein (TIGR01451 family)
MSRFTVALTTAALAYASLSSIAQAKPMVALSLSGMVVVHQSTGPDKLVPVEQTAVKSGDEIRYVIVATNSGSTAAKNLVPIGRIPAGTEYEAGSAVSKSALRPEFSLDGKSFSTAPTVREHTSAGDVVKKANPATYADVRWVGGKPLAPKAAATYTYVVRVK